MRFLRDIKNVLQAGLSLHWGPFGESGGGSFAMTFERKEKYIWVPFWTQRPLRFKSGRGGIWNFGKGTGLS
jgi:hypothetical protein